MTSVYSICLVICAYLLTGAATSWSVSDNNSGTRLAIKPPLTFVAYQVKDRVDRIMHYCDLDNEDHNSTAYHSEDCRRVLTEQRQPLFRGQGTHYVFLWVGTPPQRVSVIVDTGSHHTAFPCVGCNCGKHMDPHFDPKKSTSSSIKKCSLSGQKCFFKQAYSEGSSWHAFKVTDMVAAGSEQQVVGNQSVKFEFGCQDSETGLFRTQNVDGIMGLSAADETLPYQLHKQGVTDTKAFSLCFRVGGGIVSFGGYNEEIKHSALPSSTGSSGPSGSSLSYVKLIKGHGWYTVRLLDISLAVRSKSSTSSTGGAGSVWQEVKSIGGPMFKCNSGKGTIIDSGTTDTYLPSVLHSHFTTLFKQLSGGMTFKNEMMQFANEERMNQVLPTVIYRLAGMVEGEFVDIEVLPESYMEKVGQGKYIPRIYLTESIGAVLGANFMNNHLIVFDIDQAKVGFAKSKCQL